MRTGDVAIIKGPHPYTVGDDPDTVPDITVHADNRLTTMDGVDVTEDLQLGPRTSGHSRDGSAIVARRDAPGRRSPAASPRWSANHRWRT